MYLLHHGTGPHALLQAVEDALNICEVGDLVFGSVRTGDWFEVTIGNLADLDTLEMYIMNDESSVHIAVFASPEYSPCEHKASNWPP